MGKLFHYSLPEKSFFRLLVLPKNSKLTQIDAKLTTGLPQPHKKITKWRKKNNRNHAPTKRKKNLEL